jgi:hypothetical protein
MAKRKREVTEDRQDNTMAKRYPEVTEDRQTENTMAKR